VRINPLITLSSESTKAVAKIRKIPMPFKSYKIIFFIFLSVLSGSYAHTEESLSSVKSQFKIAIFKEKDFLSLGSPVSLTSEWLYDSLSKKFSVTYLDSNKLGDKKYLNLKTFDLLILPYGEAFPYKAFPQIKEYLFEGGGLLNIAGRPFWVPVDKIKGKWERTVIADPYKEFLSPLGIKYYQSSENNNIGLSVVTSFGFSPIRPTHGNVFPCRIPARDFYSLNGSPGVFVKAWRNPYTKGSKNIPRKWCLIGAVGEDHPLNPKNPDAQEILMHIIEYLSYPVIIHDLESDFAGYYQGEEVDISLRALNNSRLRQKVIVEFEIFDKKEKPVYKKSKSIELEPGQIITLSETWQPNVFHSSFYKIRAILKVDDIVFDKEENGFVVIDKDVLRGGTSIEIKEKLFAINGEKSLILGVNYYESKLGELMWLRPNLLKIREDFKSMGDLGINFIRIHYHHSKWFRDYFSQVVKKDLDPYLQVADTTALPTERSLRILDAIIQLAQEQGLVFCMDIFTLVPEEMGNPIGWLGLRERILDKDKVAVQKKFIRLIAQRYKDVPGVAWDLWNEPCLDREDYELLRNWVREIRESFRKNGSNQLITIGGNLSLDLLDVLDYGCIQAYEPGEFDSIENLTKPVIFNEVWNPAGCSLDEEERQAEELKKDFNAFLKTNAAGFMPWQWTRQARLWNNSSDAEQWDDELGLCVRDDGTLRPAGGIYAYLISLIRKNQK